jgi:hypothetical protein
MEALCSTGDDDSLLVLSSLQQHSNQGTTLQVRARPHRLADNTAKLSLISCMHHEQGPAQQ